LLNRAGWRLHGPHCPNARSLVMSRPAR
jgi:hypothetical protein